MDAYSWLIEPFTYAFLTRAALMGLIVSIVCAVLSCFLILKGWALMGDAISHAVLPGVGLAYLFNIPLILGGFAAAMFCSLVIGYVSRHCRVKEDAVMGIIFSGMFALGLLMVASIETDVHLLEILFGSILGVSWSQIQLSLAIGSVVVLVLMSMRKQFLLHFFDGIYSQVISLPNAALQYAFLLMLSLTIVASLEAVGIILVIALLILPGAVAHLVTQQFDRMLMVAVLLSVFSNLIGILVSFHANVATAPVIVVIQLSIFLMIVMLNNFKSIVKIR